MSPELRGGGGRVPPRASAALAGHCAPLRSPSRAAALPIERRARSILETRAAHSASPTPNSSTLPHTATSAKGRQGSIKYRGLRTGEAGWDAPPTPCQRGMPPALDGTGDCAAPTPGNAVFGAVHGLPPRQRPISPRDRE